MSSVDGQGKDPCVAHQLRDAKPESTEIAGRIRPPGSARAWQSLLRCNFDFGDAQMLVKEINWETWSFAARRRVPSKRQASCATGT
jgi:hypothetical protein